MADLYTLLASQGKSEDQYLAEDPFYSGAKSVSQWQMPQAKSNAEAILGPALQGLLMGGLAGYGKSNARETAFDEYKVNPLLQGLDGYSEQENAPEGFTVKNAQNQLLLRALGAQQAQEQKQKEIEANNELTKLLLGKDMAIGADGKLVPITAITDAQADARAKIAGAEVKAKKEAEADAFGYNPDKEKDVDSLRKEFSALPEVKNFSQVEKSAKIIDKAIKDPTAVSDLELTRYSILLIEPGMAVKEGEQQAVKDSASIPEKWRGQMLKALKGEASLSPEVREGIKGLAKRSYDGHKEQYDRTLNFYKGEATKRKLDPERISYLGDSTDADKIFTDTSKTPPVTRPGYVVERNKKTGEYRERPI